MSTSNSSKSSGLLSMQRCTIRFGGLTAVSELDLHIGGEELIGLIGPNGAGKTTAFNMITGVYQPTEGEIHFGGTPIVGQAPQEITGLGIARTLRQKTGLFQSLLRGAAFKRNEQQIESEVLEILDIFKLGRFRHTMSKNLPYGDQRRLEIVRALATKPRLLLLDEPAAGMNPTEKTELTRLIGFIKDKFRISVLLVEHDMKVVMGICERIVVLDHGIKIAEGSPSEVRNDIKVVEAYLGDKHLKKAATDADSSPAD